MTYLEKTEFLKERRIYVLVTPTVEVEKTGMTLPISYGRMAAQACHAVSKLKFWHCELWDNGKEMEEWAKVYVDEPITTIVLRVRDQKELEHVLNLTDDTKVVFYDTNNDYYGSSELVMTAVAIGPVKKEDVVGICDYLPLL